jgi:hypothetical protein
VIDVRDPLLQLTIALALAGLFGTAATHKLLAFREWPGVVRNYRLLPDDWVWPGAIALVTAEAFTAVVLLVPSARAAGGGAAAALLTMYAAALAINLRRGRTMIDCGCFAGRLRHGIAPWMVVRNLVLIVLAAALLVPVTSRPLTLLDYAVALAGALTLAFLYPVAVVVARPAPRTFDQNYLASIGDPTV